MAENDEAEDGRSQAAHMDDIKQAFHDFDPHVSITTIDSCGAGSYHQVFRVDLSDGRRLAARVSWPQDEYMTKVMEMQSHGYEESQAATLIYLNQRSLELVPRVYGFWKSTSGHGIVCIMEYISGVPLIDSFYKLPTDAERNFELQKVAQLLVTLYNSTNLSGIGSLQILGSHQSVTVDGNNVITLDGVVQDGKDLITLDGVACAPLPGAEVITAPLKRGPFKDSASWLSAIVLGDHDYHYDNDDEPQGFLDRIWKYIGLSVRRSILRCIIWLRANHHEGYRLFVPDLGLHNIIREEETGRLVLIDLDGAAVLPEWMIDYKLVNFQFSDEKNDEHIAPMEKMKTELEKALKRNGIRDYTEAGRNLRQLRLLAREVGSGLLVPYGKLWHLWRGCWNLAG